MALQTCPDCRKEYSDDAPRCVHCGARNPARRGSRDALFGKVLLAVIGVVVAFAVLSAVMPKRTPEHKALDAAIRLCDEQYEKSRGSAEMKAKCDAPRDERWELTRPR